MFACSVCGKLSNKREPAIPIMLEISEKEYEKGDGTLSFGFEIVKEGVVPASHNHTLIRGPITLNATDRFYLPLPYSFYPLRLTIHRLKLDGVSHA